MSPLRHFSSDNNAGAHPEVLRAIAEANTGHVPSYGGDPYTAAAEAAFRAAFGEGTSAFLVWNGTAANVLGLQAVTRPFQAVICAAGAHIDVDECAAPERFTGCKLLPVPTTDGKLGPDDLEPLLLSRGDEHRVQPRVLSITQATELGTVYRPDELRALTDAAHASELLVHMDGARICNAAASLGLSFREITTDVGVDLVSFGGTKVGLLGAEAVLFLNGLEIPEFKYLRKQGTHLASKMRFLAVQFEVLLRDELWRRSASHANAMARRLAEQLWGLDRVRLTQPVEANGVFAVIPPETVTPLQARRRFQVWNRRLQVKMDDSLGYYRRGRGHIRCRYPGGRGLSRARIAIVALLTITAPLEAQDSIPAPPDTSAVVPADSLVPAGLAGLTPLQRDSALNAARPVSPLGALGRSILVPGWGQAKLNRKLTGAVFITVEAISLGMALKAANELDYLRRTQSSRADAKANERDDWLVIWASITMSGSKRVSAHLWDFPRPQAASCRVEGGRQREPARANTMQFRSDRYLRLGDRRPDGHPLNLRAVASRIHHLFRRHRPGALRAEESRYGAALQSGDSPLAPGSGSEAGCRGLQYEHGACPSGAARRIAGPGNRGDRARCYRGGRRDQWWPDWRDRDCGNHREQRLRQGDPCTEAWCASGAGCLPALRASGGGGMVRTSGRAPDSRGNTWGHCGRGRG